MSDKNILYSQNVIEFVAVATESVSFLENFASFEKVDFLQRLSKLLSIIYLKTSTLPTFEQQLDEDLEQFVSEQDYEYVREGIASLIGDEKDAFLDCLPADLQWNEEPSVNTISENLADMYQDLKDFAMRYQIGNEDIMYDALWACQESFRSYWGLKLLSSLRAIHYVLNADGGLQPDDEENSYMTQRSNDTQSFLHRRINEMNDEDYSNYDF